MVGKENKVFHPLAIYLIINLFLREVMKMASNKLFDLDASLQVKKNA